MKDSLVEHHENLGETIFVGGHSEEVMIKDFPRVMGKETQRAMAGKNPDEKELRVKIIVYNSDSPCTTEDKSTSCNLPGWPVTCTAKLLKLANDHPDIEFEVYWYRAYKTLAEGNAKIRAEEVKKLREAARDVARQQRRQVTDEEMKAVGLRADLNAAIPLNEKLKARATTIKEGADFAAGFNGRIQILPFSYELRQKILPYPHL